MKTLKIISNMFHLSNYDYDAALLPYHRFNAYDYEKLLNPFDIGQEIIFKNQTHEKIVFRVTKSTLGKKMHRTIVSDKCWIKNFYFDEQQIEMECLHPQFGKQKLVYMLKKFPSLLQLSHHKLKFSKESQLISTLHFPFWNNADTLIVDYSKNVSTLIIDSVFYTHVRVLESNNTNIYINKNVHKIYFDEQKGIIGFDDLDGNVWRVGN